MPSAATTERDVQFQHIATTQQSLKRDFRRAESRSARTEAALARNRRLFQGRLLKVNSAGEARIRAVEKQGAKNRMRLARIPPPTSSQQRTVEHRAQRALDSMPAASYEAVLGPTVLGALHEGKDSDYSCVCPSCHRFRRFGPVPLLPGDWLEGFVEETATCYFYLEVDDASVTLAPPRGSHPAFRVVVEAGHSVHARCECPVPRARRLHLLRLFKRYARSIAQKQSAPVSQQSSVADSAVTEQESCCSGLGCEDPDCQWLDLDSQMSSVWESL